MVGVNGVGKTTTIGKLAARYREMGRSVLLVAGDTFRAAAIDQLEIWADRTGAQIVKQESGTDPSAVVFDGIRAAVARGTDVVLIDTAGRLHTKVNLMEELKKVHRIIAREVPGAPHEVLLVVDATTGQNAVAQARTFQAAVAVTGVILTKLDGSAKGGVVVAIRHELGLPIRFVGLGETAQDLQPFDPDLFAESLFAGEES
jgi:fused signal recognition particle receptor